MNNFLDNPAWGALISGNKDLAYGNDKVKYFNTQVSPFAAMEENTAANFQTLYELTDHTSPLLIVAANELHIPRPWAQIRFIKGVQMVYNGPAVPQRSDDQLVPLTEKDVPQMLDLTRLTNPGPFAPRTIEFGHYEGIFNGEKLVAMAGQRLHPFQYAEISAVCTHPEHTGNGYARQLLLSQLGRIQAASNIPFLHVRHDNDRAIGVYESLGFVKRTSVYFYVIKKME